MRRRAGHALVAFLAFLVAPPAFAAEGDSTVLIGITAGDALAERNVRTLEDILLSGLQAEDVEILGVSDVQRLLGFERQRQMLGCEDGGCVTELAAALGARYLVSADVGTLGRRYVVTGKVIDGRSARVLHRSVRQCEDADALAGALESLGHEIGTKLRDAGAVRAPRMAGRSGSEVIVRAGLGARLGVLGLGIEYRRGMFGLGLGSGTHLAGASLLFGRTGGGPYLDVHGVLARTGPLLAATERRISPGIGFGATAGWDFRPRERLSLVVGGGVAFKAGVAPSLGELFVLDASLGWVF